MKPIRLSKHVKEYELIRGFSEKEVIQAIRKGDWQDAKKGNRLESKFSFAYETEWNGKYYKTKEVKPVFVDEETEIVVITVYTYFS
ncbi:MAG: DUF4258 domain-containing protein [Leptospiraceae bacterium]|nr:DUF4258 domain-containing protein [Leptospiraceae bacterium]